MAERDIQGTIPDNCSPSVASGKKVYRPKGYWKEEANIEGELRILAQRLGHFPTQEEMAVSSLTPLSKAISETGGTTVWRQRLDFDAQRRDTGYWDDPENVKREVERVMKEHGLKDLPSQAQLTEFGETSVGAGIRRTGGYPSWREQLGLKLKIKRKGFWTEEEIRRQAVEFLQAHGQLSHVVLSQSGRFGLQVAIGRRFPGGLTALRNELGVGLERMPVGFWTREKIESEARAFIKEHGRISRKLLADKGRSDLLSAIIVGFPGKFIGLKEFLAAGMSGNVDEVFGDFFEDEQNG